MIYTAYYNSPIGEIMIAERYNKLICLHIGAQKQYLSTVDDEISLMNTEILNQTKNWLDRYFAGEKPSPCELTLAPVGVEFRQTVWHILCEIPYGKTITYGEIAKETARRMGKEKMSAQAIGGAVGHNQIPIIIPCHRVIGKNGNLTGYTGGMEIKIKLLEQEGISVKNINGIAYVL